MARMGTSLSIWDYKKKVAPVASGCVAVAEPSLPAVLVLVSPQSVSEEALEKLLLSGARPNMFSSGDQGNKREEFWRHGFSTCPSCGLKDISMETCCAGCRMNGDGYGTEVYTCKNCKWTTSFQYDDASDHYYYETRFWTREPPKPIPRQELTDALRSKFRRIFGLIGRNGTIDSMIQDGISKDDINGFVQNLEEAAAATTA